MNHPKLRRWTLGARYIIFSPFPLFVSVYVYASVWDFVCIASVSPFVLGFCPSVFFLFLFYFTKIFFLITIFYFNNFTLSYFISSYFISFYFILFLSIFSHGWKALGAPARHQGCVSEVGEPTSGHWSTRDLPAPCNTKRQNSPRDLHLNTKTQLHSMTSKLQCWTPYVKQLARQEHSPIH